MRINKAQPNEGAWFDVPDDPDGGRIRLRVCPPGQLKKIRREANGPKKVEYEKGQRFEFFDTDPVAFERLLWDYCIADWENIYDESGEPLPCDTENKVFVVNECLELSAFIAESMERLQADETEYNREREKNSSTSQRS